MKFRPRALHKWLAAWIALPLVISLVTGIIYRVGRSWFGMTKPVGNEILKFHTGEWIGESFSHGYILLTGLGLLTLVLTGGALLFQKKSARTSRRLHRWMGTILLLPLFATSTTGIAYHFGEKVLHFSEPTQKLLMTIHQGSWLGPQLRPFYILFIGVGLLFLIISGLKFILNFRQPTQS